MTKYVIASEDYLAHHGILGMHWGIRRFQPYPKGWDGIKGKFLGKVDEALTGRSNGQNSGGLQKMSRSSLGVIGNVDYTLNNLQRKKTYKNGVFNIYEPLPKKNVSKYLDTFEVTSKKFTKILDSSINDRKFDKIRKDVSNTTWKKYKSLADEAKILDSLVKTMENSSRSYLGSTKYDASYSKSIRDIKNKADRLRNMVVSYNKSANKSFNNNLYLSLLQQDANSIYNYAYRSINRNWGDVEKRKNYW